MSPVLGAVLTACSIILGAAGMVSLVAAWWRPRNTTVNRPTHRPRARRVESQFAIELGRIGHHLAAQPPTQDRLLSPPVTGRAPVADVDWTAFTAYGADDTQPLPLPQADRGELIDGLRVGGWNRAHLRRHAGPHHRR